MLIVCAGLFVRALQRAGSMNPGLASIVICYDGCVMKKTAEAVRENGVFRPFEMVERKIESVNISV